jgi:hypothetical protein
MPEDHQRLPGSRRTFLQSALTAPVLTAFTASSTANSGTTPEVSSVADLIQDTPRTLTATGADSGTFFPMLGQLADRDDYSLSFLSDRFSSIQEFQQQGRARLLECFGRQPQRVEPQAEVVDRQDLGDIVREKVFFQTTPDFRVPAYLHLPKSAATIRR